MLIALLKKFWSLPYVKPIVLGLALFVLGFVIGRSHKVVVTKTVTVDDTVTKQKLQEALQINVHLQEELDSATKTIADLKITKVTKIHRVKEKDGTTVTDTTTTTDTSNNTTTTTNSHETHDDNTTTTDNTTDTTDTTHHIKTEKTTTVMPNEWYVGITAGFYLSDISHPPGKLNLGPVTPGIEVKHRLDLPFLPAGGPFWVGGALDTNNTFRATLGVTF